MTEGQANLLLFAATAITLAAGHLILRRRQAMRASGERLFEDEEIDVVPAPTRTASNVAGGSVLLGGVVGFAAALVLWLGAGVYAGLSAAFGLMIGTLAWLIHGFVVERRTVQIEIQLANAIDLIISALRAGSPILDALEAAAREVRGPIRGALAEASGRLRLGERPGDVFEDVYELLPLDSVRLFTQALIVQWQTGGSLAPALSSVGRSVRDRVDVARRVRAQTAEVQFSVVGVLGVTYAIGLVAWQTAPDRVASFVASDLGGGLLAMCIVLQAIGLLWMARLARVMP